MNKFKDTLETRLMPAMDKFTNNRYVKIMMNAFMGTSAITIGASFFVLIRSLPLGDWYTNFLMTTGLYDILNLPILITNNLMSLYLVVCFGYFTAKSFNKNPLNGSIIALGSFLMLIPFEATAYVANAAGEMVPQQVADVIPTSAFGAQGIFLAMLVGILATRIYIWFDDKNFKIKMPASVPENVSNMFETMIPASVIFVLFMLVRIACSYTPFGTAQNLIYGLLQAPLTNVGGGYWGAFIFTFGSNLLWMFGIHGPILMYSGMAMIYTTVLTENAIAFASGLPCPNPEWAYSYFTGLGGSGSTFALVLLMVALAKSQHLKTLGKVALPTSIFNINEPLVFGMPIVMNPTLAIPFIAVPAVNFFLTTFADRIGFLTITGANVNNYLPVGVASAFATGNWTGLVWTIVLVIVDLLIYYPFFMAYDKKKVAEEAAYAEEADDLI